MKSNFTKLMLVSVLAFSMVSINVFGQSKSRETSKTQTRNEMFKTKFKVDLKQEKKEIVSKSSKGDTTFYPQQIHHYEWLATSWNQMYNELRAYNPDMSLANIVLVDHVSSDSTQRISYTYDSQNRLVMAVEEMKYIAGWEYTSREGYVYDAQGNMTEELYEMWNSGNWEIIWGERKTYTYNANNDPTEIIYQDYDSQSSSWENYEKEEFTYDVAGNMTRMIYFDWDGVSAWEQYERITLTYGAQNSPVEFLIEEWDDLQNAWEPSAKIHSITWHNWAGSIWYGDPLTYTMAMYAGVAWIDLVRATFTYDGYGGYVEVIEENSLSGWVNESRNSEFYDNKYNYIGSHYETWVSNAWELMWGEKYDITYNSAGAMTERIERYWSGTAYENNWKEEFFNFLTFDKPVSIPSLNARIYPNPAENVTYIDLPTDSRNAQIDIINIQGSLVYSSKSNGGTVNLDLSGLAKGVYFVRIHADGLLQIEKLVIK